MKKLFTVVVTCSFLAVPLHAQEVFMSLTRSTIPITDTPTNVEVITAQDFEKTSARTVGDVVGYVPGVILKKSGSEGALSEASIRGFTALQVLVVIDDVPQIPDLTGEIDLSRIPLDNIERIEIVRGGGSAVYGPNAEGGVIHIITKHPTAAVDAQLTSEAGSYKTYHNRGRVGVNRGPVQAQVTASRDLSDGFQQNSSYRNTDITGLLSYNAGVYGKLAYNIEGEKGTIGLPSGTPVPLDQWNGSVERQANDLTAFQTTTLRNNRVNYTNRINGIDLTARLANNVQDLDAFQFGSLTQIRTEGRNAFAKLEQEKWGAVGYEFYQRRLDSNVFGVNRDNAWGAFLQTYLLSTEKVKLTPGFRYDFDNAYGDAWSPRVQLVAKLNDSWKASASANRSFRAPTFADLYNPFVPLANRSTHLRPEFTWIYDVGLSGKPAEGWETSLSGYYSRTTDKIATDPNKSFAAYNLDKAYSRGFEAAAGYEYRRVRQRLGYSYLDAKGTSAGSDYRTLQFSPKHKIDYRADISLPWQTVTTFDLVYLHKQWTNIGESGIEIPGYVVTNLRLTKRVGSWLELFVACNNVLDRHYAENADSFNGFFPRPGRNYLGGVTVRFLR